MFDIGGPEFIFLALLALLIFGPKRLPELGRTAGRQAARLRRQWEELRREVEREVAGSGIDEVRRDLREAGDDLRAARGRLRSAGSTGSTGSTGSAGPEPGGDGGSEGDGGPGAPAGDGG